MDVGQRRILRIDGGEFTVAREARFGSEDELHAAIAAHPEVLPSEDLGLGPLTAIASKLTLGNWELDLLAADPRGRLVIVEFKKGTENPDVRTVIAQILDYGSLLWGRRYEELADLCKASRGFGGTLVDHVGEQLLAIGHDGFDAAAFEAGVATSLGAGDFVFVYVTRDMDERTRRIMTYLAEGQRMWFFAVEVDCFRERTTSTVLVPRTAFVPSWVAESRTSGVTTARFRRELSEQSREVQELVRRMDEFAAEHGLVAVDTETGRAYKVPPAIQAVGLYWSSSRGVEFNLQRFRDRGADDVADELLKCFSRFVGRPLGSRWPAVPIDEVAARAADAFSECIGPYVVAAKATNSAPDEPGPADPEQS